MKASINKYRHIITAYAVTPTHFGIGRAPGVVDLPIARDPLGYPMMPSTGVKGALKNKCANLCTTGPNPFKDDGRIDCSKIPVCCCLFGPEPGESGQGASALSVLDFSLLAMPVPSTTHGWIYITTPHLLLRLESLMEYMGIEKEKRDALAATINKIGEMMKDGKAIASPELPGERSWVGLPGYSYGLTPLGSDDLAWIDVILPRDGIKGLVREFRKRLIIVSDEDGPRIIEKGILRYWRVRLDYKTKTVSTGGLWSEEYLPIGTIFVGGLVPSRRINIYCNSIKEDDVKRALSILSNGAYLFVGGKESVGKGLMKLLLGGGNEGSK